jgi:hypothetical protein
VPLVRLFFAFDPYAENASIALFLMAINTYSLAGKARFFFENHVLCLVGHRSAHDALWVAVALDGKKGQAIGLHSSSVLKPLNSLLSLMSLHY